MKVLQFSVNVPKFIAAKALGAVFGNRIFYSGPFRTIRLKDIPEPTLPTPEWVKLRTTYCGFCGSDLHLISLHDSPTASPFTSFPCVLGHEIVAEVVEVGSRVSLFKPGDRVVINPALGCRTRGIDPSCPVCRSGRPGSCENFAQGNLPPGMFIGINSGVNGGFAPYLSAHESQLFHVPDALNPESAVMTEPLAVALQTLFDNLPANGEKILVIGGGVIGNLIIQSTRVLAPGCRIALIDPSSVAVEFAGRAGADDIIPAGEVFGRTAQITGAKIYKPMLGMKIPMGGFHRIYDTVGSAATLNLSMRLLAARGTLSVVGIGGDVKLDLTPLWLKLQTIKGVYASGSVTLDGKERHVFDIALDFMNRKKINADILVTHKFSIEEYRRMIQVNLHKDRHRAAKTVVSFMDHPVT
jgi:threonine dehydrogenase-like Zn-dependent dehydrogenase